MRKGCEFCQDCTNRAICPPQLQPEVFDEDDNIRSIPDRFGELEFQQLPINCRHLTCSMRGMLAAYKPWKTNKFTQFPIVDADGKTQAKDAIVFGTADKPTYLGSMRIITRAGLIASFQNDLYYFTGQRITPRDK